ncbi:acyltransferase family protein [Propionivibrio sp.]|uniref:acyltransferase family protein n=1 Tax=Propionivibrio sp. TaxID=2212460 RepID=UPI0039E554FF
MTAHTVQPAVSRFPFIDAVKAIASQLIVLHHLAFYGPMSDYARAISPGLITWLSQYARIAVQGFLVMGGFLAAQALARDGRPVAKPVGKLLWRRYLKLAIPYLVTLLLAIAAAAVSRHLITHDSIPDAPGLFQFIAHILLLQGVFGFDGLSAGVWYIAIDFQLYALLLIILRSADRIWPERPGCARGCVIALIVASLYVLNRDAAWDNWAVYFFGAYGLGAIAYWGTRPGQTDWWAIATAVAAAVALVVDYRSRIFVALLVAIALGLSRCSGIIATWPRTRLLAWLGEISYSVFLVHFPVCLLVNAVFERFVQHAPAIQFAGMLLAWFASIACGALLHRAVERRAAGWLKR